MVRVLTAAALVGLGFVFACSGTTTGGEGGAGAGSAPATPQASPVKKCEAYASKWCNKVFSCYVQVGRLDESGRQRNVDSCNNLLASAIPCSAVTSVGGDYDACLSGIDAMDCSKWDVPINQVGTVGPPTSCNEALAISG